METIIRKDEHRTLVTTWSHQSESEPFCFWIEQRLVKDLRESSIVRVVCENLDDFLSFLADIEKTIRDFKNHATEEIVPGIPRCMSFCHKDLAGVITPQIKDLEKK